MGRSIVCTSCLHLLHRMSFLCVVCAGVYVLFVELGVVVGRAPSQRISHIHHWSMARMNSTTSVLDTRVHWVMGCCRANRCHTGCITGHFRKIFPN